MWTNLFEMIADVRRFVSAGGRVEVADDPVRRIMGYRGAAPWGGREWLIKLTDVRNSTLPPLSREQHLIAEKFRTPSGRSELLCPRSLADKALVS